MSCVKGIVLLELLHACSSFQNRFMFQKYNDFAIIIKKIVVVMPDSKTIVKYLQTILLHRLKRISRRTNMQDRTTPKI